MVYVELPMMAPTPEEVIIPEPQDSPADDATALDIVYQHDDFQE